MNTDGSLSGLRGLGTALPRQFPALAGLLLVSAAEALAGFGFTGAYLAEETHPLALAAAERALADAKLAPREIDVLLWAGALSEGHQRASEQPTGGVLDGFCYSASWLQEAL